MVLVLKCCKLVTCTSVYIIRSASFSVCVILNLVDYLVLLR